jgi:hypothetical protein
VKKPKHFIVGGETHQIMEGKLKPENATEPDAVMSAKRLKELEQSLDIHIESREGHQKIKLDGMKVPERGKLGSVTLTRIIDGRGIDRNKQPILLDYKTAGSPWMTFQDENGEWFAPQARGAQSVLYLLNPANDPSWPKMIYYLVVTTRGMREKQFFIYKRDEDAEIAMLQKLWDLEQAWSDDYFPRDQGYECTRCPFVMACNKSPDWEKFYDKISSRKR